LPLPTWFSLSLTDPKPPFSGCCHVCLTVWEHPCPVIIVLHPLAPVRAGKCHLPGTCLGTCRANDVCPAVAWPLPGYLPAPIGGRDHCAFLLPSLGRCTGCDPSPRPRRPLSPTRCLQARQAAQIWPESGSYRMPSFKPTSLTEVPLTPVITQLATAMAA